MFLTAVLLLSCHWCFVAFSFFANIFLWLDVFIKKKKKFSIPVYGSDEMMSVLLELSCRGTESNSSETRILTAAWFGLKQVMKLMWRRCQSCTANIALLSLKLVPFVVAGRILHLTIGGTFVGHPRKCCAPTRSSTGNIQRRPLFSKTPWHNYILLLIRNY